MKLAHVADGKVVNMIEVEPGAVPEWASDWPVADEAGIGWGYDGEVFSAPAAPTAEEIAARLPPVSFSQILAGLVETEMISEVEGEAWLAGTGLPADVLAVIDTLPTGQQFRTRGKALRMSAAYRLDPLVVALGQARGMTTEQINAFWLYCMTIA
jgi:hypothetical protein